MATDKWQQAGQLMQPALIRLIDQIRKQLEQSDWSGTYETLETWPEGTTAAIKTQVAELQSQLERASAEQAVALEQVLSQLPQPDLVYLLHLQKNEHQVGVNLWQLCYQVCFRNYDPTAPQKPEDLQVDTVLIDSEGEVDWQTLDQKAEQTVKQVFSQLPAIP